MLHKKSIKILSFFVAVVIAFFCFFSSLTASAKTVTTNINNFIDIVLSDLYIYKSTNGAFSNVTASRSMSESGENLYYAMTCTESWGTGQWFRMVFTFDIKADLQRDLNYYGSFYIVRNSSLYNILTDKGGAVYFRNEDGSITYCTMTKDSGNLKCEFVSDGSKVPTSLHVYLDLSNIVSCVANRTVFDVSFMDLKFNQATDFEMVIENQNNSTNQIINNQDNNTNQIISNQNNNAQQIQQNQDKNTDRLINAGSDVEQPDFNSANDKLDDTTNQMESI